jgi:hypothetical protein
MVKKYRIFGSSLTSIVLVNNLSKQNSCQVEWILTNKNRYGGHFAGSDVFSSPLDIGMVALEVDEPISQQDSMATVSPPTGIQVNPFLRLVKNWFIAQGVTMSEIKVETRYEGKNYPDIFISNNTLLFHETKSKTNLSQKLIEVKVPKDLHPINKNKATFVRYMDLKNYFREVYGNSFFTKIVFQFINKINSSLLDKVIVSSHRSIWIPLYHPETISSKTVNIKENARLIRVFSCFRQDTIARLLQEMVNRIKSSDIVTVRENVNNFGRESLIEYTRDKDDDLITIFSDDQKLISNEVKLNTETVDIFVIYIKTDSDLKDIVVFDTDPNNDYYRLTSRAVRDRFGYNYVCLESTKNYTEILKFNKNYSLLKKYVHSVIGVDLEIKDVCIKSGKLNVMTKEHVLDLEGHSEEVSNFLEKNNIVNLSHNGLNNSMNEQILSALWYIESSGLD